jgi:hypothetical protein
VVEIPQPWNEHLHPPMADSTEIQKIQLLVRSFKAKQKIRLRRSFGPSRFLSFSTQPVEGISDFFQVARRFCNSEFTIIKMQATRFLKKIVSKRSGNKFRLKVRLPVPGDSEDSSIRETKQMRNFSINQRDFLKFHCFSRVS